MASARLYGRSEMKAMLQTEEISPEAIEVLLASTSAPPEFHGSRSTVNFEDIHGTSAQPSYLHQMEMEETENDDFDDSFNHTEKKRRLTSSQVQFLEKSFEVENKLEPERKIQLAMDLGLQPRQVAIWFQNRRARWKTKQLEKDYEVLKTKHEYLKNDHGRLVQEKEDLMAEIQTLKNKLSQKERESSISIKQEHVYDDFITEEKKPNLPVLEDICSANSILFDPNSPRCTAEGGGGHQQYYLARLEPADSSNRLELNRWNLSHANDDEGVECGRLPKREHGSSGFGLIQLEEEAEQEEKEEEEHALWSWNY